MESIPFGGYLKKSTLKIYDDEHWKFSFIYSTIRLRYSLFYKALFNILILINTTNHCDVSWTMTEVSIAHLCWIEALSNIIRADKKLSDNRNRIGVKKADRDWLQKNPLW